ncbi:MAG: hypothetical protein OXT67_02505 [Zetaproteobacteria bacterium]|nr:hypothetical protein [Zetaproteobacteria bacterium]
MRKQHAAIAYLITIIATTLLFFSIHAPIYFLDYHRAHGDYAVAIHFPVYNLIDALWYDGEITLWQPYLNMGSHQLYEQNVVNPIVTLLCLLLLYGSNWVGWPVHNFFAVTHFCHSITYSSIFALGCVALSREAGLRYPAQAFVLFLAVMGSHIYGATWVGYYSAMYLPLFLTFYLRTLRLQPQTFFLDSSGLIALTALMISSSFIYLHTFTNLLFLLGGITLIYVMRYFVECKQQMHKFLQNFSTPSRMHQATLGLAMLTLFTVLMFKGYSKLMLSTMQSMRRPIDYSTADFLRQLGLNHYHTFTLHGILMQSIDRFGNIIRTDARYPYAIYLGLCSLLLSLTYVLFGKHKWKWPVVAMIAGMTLLATPPHSTLNFLSPLLAAINPFFTMGTRFLGFNLVYTAPLWILLCGLAMDAFIHQRFTFPSRWAHMGRYTLCICATLAVGNFYQHGAITLATHLGGAALLMAICLLLYTRGHPSIGAALLLTCIVGEVSLDMWAYVRRSFHPDAWYTSQPEQHSTLHLPRWAYPIPFAHNFAYLSGDGSINTSFAEPTGSKGSTLVNGHFKFFSPTRWHYEFDSPVSNLMFLQQRVPRLFFAKQVASYPSTPALIQALAKQLPQLEQRRTASFVGSLPAQIAELPFPNTEPEQDTHQTVSLTTASASQVDEGEWIKYSFSLKNTAFPKYLTTHILTQQPQNMAFQGLSQPLQAIYFGRFTTAYQFQIGFQQQQQLSLTLPPQVPLPKDLQLHFQNPLQAEQLNIEYFNRDRLHLHTERQQPGLLVYMDRFHPNWQATLDGAPTTIFRVNGDFKAIRVPAGKHEVHFHFVDHFWKWSYIFSLCGYLLATVLVLLIWSHLQRQTNSPSTPADASNPAAI